MAVNRFLLYVAIIYLALCAFCLTCAAQSVNTRFGDTEEKRVDRMFLEVISCEVLADYAERQAMLVLEVEKDLKAPRCKFMGKVDPICRAWTQLRAEYMQALTDAEDAGHRRCGWDRS